MGSTNKTLLTALIVSLFSLSAIQGIKILRMENQPQVLGVTAPSAPGVPCSLINSWQQRFCSSTVPTAVPSYPPTPYVSKAPTPSNPTPYVSQAPTKTPPTPTPIVCNPSATVWGKGICESNTELFSSIIYLCQDKVTKVTVGDTSGINCYQQNDLYWQAITKCSALCSANPTTPNPTPRVATVAPSRSPLPTPKL